MYKHLPSFTLAPLLLSIDAKSTHKNDAPIGRTYMSVDQLPQCPGAACPFITLYPRCPNPDEVMCWNAILNGKPVGRRHVPIGYESRYVHTEPCERRFDRNFRLISFNGAVLPTLIIGTYPIPKQTHIYYAPVGSKPIEPDVFSKNITVSLLSQRTRLATYTCETFAIIIPFNYCNMQTKSFNLLYDPCFDFSTCLDLSASSSPASKPWFPNVNSSTILYHWMMHAAFLLRDEEVTRDLSEIRRRDRIKMGNLMEKSRVSAHNAGTNAAINEALKNQFYSPFEHETPKEAIMREQHLSYAKGSYCSF